MHETQQPRDPKKTTGIVYAVILVVLLLLNFWAFPAMMKGQVKQVDYGTFLNMLEGGELSTVEIQDQQIYFVDKNDTTYCTNSIAQDLQLVTRLESAGVSFGKVYNQTTWVDTLLGWVISLLPMIILIVWFNRMMRKRVGEMTGGANSMIFGGGKSGAKQYVVEDGKSIKFADVAGEDEAKESLQERSKAKVPGEKSWTKNICHIIINAKLQLWGCEILYFCCVKKIINERLRYK